MPDETTPTEYLNVRDLPTWAANAIRARASKTGVSYSAMVRIILADWATKEVAPTQPAPATTAVNAGA